MNESMRARRSGSSAAEAKPSAIVADGESRRRHEVVDRLAAHGFSCTEVCSGWDLIVEMKERAAPFVVVAHLGSLYPDPSDIVVLSRIAGCNEPFVLYGDGGADRLVSLDDYPPVLHVPSPADVGACAAQEARYVRELDVEDTVSQERTR